MENCLYLDKTMCTEADTYNLDDVFYKNVDLWYLLLLKKNEIIETLNKRRDWIKLSEVGLNKFIDLANEIHIH